MSPYRAFYKYVLPRLTAEAVYGDLDLRWKGDRGHGPCPLHGGDNRYGFTVFRDRLNWYCGTHRCKPDRGDVLDYIERSRGLSTRDAMAYLATVAQGKPARPMKPRASRAQQPPLPAAEVEAVWSSALPVPTDREAVAWLGQYRIDPAAVARLDLARVLPHGAPVPSWASHWFWKERGARGFGSPPAWRLLLPVYDIHGRLASLRARCTMRTLPQTRSGEASKEMAPKGGGTTGLILADGLGRLLLEQDPAAIKRVRQLGLLIAEGTKDLLTVATERGALPTWAVYQDAWAPEHAARVPDGATVTIATHADEKGEEYANTIGRSLHGRSVKLLRRDWSK
jgi:hypothetical protein